MNSIKQIKILVSFPLGAYFHLDIIEYTYKQFLKMLKKITCVNIESKCNECTLCNECQYYRITGENFKEYPGIIFEKDIFSENIFKENEEYEFIVYLVGNCDIYKDYLEIFFKEYLNYKLAGYDFLIKRFECDIIQDKECRIKKLNVYSIIESLDFIYCYNNMVKYYNRIYNTNYHLMHTISSITRIKNVNEGIINVYTRKIRKTGYIYSLELDDYLSKNILKLGIGKYNFIGGGKIAISSKDEG